jgi:hypothetical protein
MVATNKAAAAFNRRLIKSQNFSQISSKVLTITFAGIFVVDHTPTISQRGTVQRSNSALSG